MDKKIENIVSIMDNIEYGFKDENGNNIIYDTYEALVNNPQIKKLIEKIVNDTISLKKGFRTCEKIFKIALLSESFKVGRELSAKLEMKRFKIAEMYGSLIATLF